jgi:hypothetical protein
MTPSKATNIGYEHATQIEYAKEDPAVLHLIAVCLYRTAGDVSSRVKSCVHATKKDPFLLHRIPVYFCPTMLSPVESSKDECLPLHHPNE